MATYKTRLAVLESSIETENQTLIFSRYDEDDDGIVAFAKFGGITVSHRQPGECLQSLIDRSVVGCQGAAILRAVYAD